MTCLPKSKASGGYGRPQEVRGNYFGSNHCRTIFNTQTGELGICLADLLKAGGSATNPARVIPEIKEALGEGGVIVTPLQTPGGIQNMTFVTEPAEMYVISRMRTETSKRLNRWLFGEMIPAIQKTGMYATPATADKFLADPDLIIQALTQMKADRAKQLATIEELRKKIDATTRNTATPRMDGAE